MAIADVGETFLFYRTVGAGPACLVMHGGLGIDHNAYSPGLDPLGEGMRLVYYDHRCHGRSGRPDPSTISLARLADDADELRQALDLDQLGVLGHSFGGFAAFEYAARHPAHVAFLIVVCSSPTLDFMSELPAILESKMTAEMRAEVALPPPTTNDEWASRNALLPLYFYDYKLSYHEALTSSVVRNIDGARCADLEGWQRWDELSELHVPTLLIAGRHDWIPHLDRLTRLATLMRSADLVVFERSGHYPWLEEPDSFKGIVVDWVQHQRRRQPRP